MTIMIPYVSDICQSRYLSFHNKLLNHPNSLLSNIASSSIPDNPPRRLKRRRRSLETDSEEEERPARNAANARERARMRVLSRAFSRLKTTLPWVPPDTKLSKLDTLRLATSYIAHLRRVLGAGQPQPSLPHPQMFSNGVDLKRFGRGLLRIPPPPGFP
ncbi:unnamed protein product [Nezara viridula]|uniref:BHLH domain-containing protein n=1 Tax=Nezara viridula TaxID=85310 RepID=A0A9P0MPW3_NEZVI|nr:unnamed protein product [Nezara viridula]